MATELTGIVGAAAGASTLLIALLLVATRMWQDTRYTRALELRVKSLEEALTTERDARRRVESALVAAGIPLPEPDRRLTDRVPEPHHES